MPSVPSATVSAHAVSGDKHLAGGSGTLVFKGMCSPQTNTNNFNRSSREETVLSPNTGGKNGHCRCEQISNMMPSHRAFKDTLDTPFSPHGLTLDANPWI